MPSVKSVKFDSLFKEATTKKASDIHFVVGLRPYLRIDGVLEAMNSYPVLTNKAVSEMVFPQLSKEQRERFDDERELDFSLETSDFVRYRINLHWEQGHVGLVARVIPAKIPSMTDLMMPDVIYDILNYRSGLILVTGPTGHGKTTTLASMVEYINETRSENIITLEDPIEFRYTPKKSIVAQRELGSDFLSFPSALKHVVRQDPDVILLGEMRDLETISSAVTLAETGHLVFATLHTFTAPNTIDRIIDIFPPYQQQQVRLQISMILRSVIAQRLLPKKGGGRIAAREILINNTAVSNLIRENKVVQLRNVLQTNKGEGMRTMDQDLITLVKEGYVDRAVVVPFMEDKNRLK